MGINITVESTIDAEWNTSFGIRKNCKWDWNEQNINYKFIFSIIRFAPTILYDHFPNFWTWDQLECVLDKLKEVKICISENLQILEENPDQLIDIYDNTNYNNVEYKEKRNNIIKEDMAKDIVNISKLIELFTIYVDKKCIMIIN